MNKTILKFNKRERVNFVFDHKNFRLFKKVSLLLIDTTELLLIYSSFKTL